MNDITCGVAIMKQELEVKASDPGFVSDFPAFCRVAGFENLGVKSDRGTVTHF